MIKNGIIDECANFSVKNVCISGKFPEISRIFRNDFPNENR